MPIIRLTMHITRLMTMLRCRSQENKGGGGGEGYLRLLNKASGAEIADLLGLNGLLLPQNPLEKVGGEAPHIFQLALR